MLPPLDIIASAPFPTHCAGSSSLNVCGPSLPPECLLCLKSMALGNHLPLDPSAPLPSPSYDAAAALGNFTSLLWSFGLDR